MDISNLDASYNNHKTVKWRSVAMSDNGLYQTAIVSMNTPYDNSVSNIFYSYTEGTTWNIAKDVNGNPLPTNYIWNKVIIAGTGDWQIAFSTNNSKLWYSTTQGRTWADSNLNYEWTSVDFAYSNLLTPVIVAATGKPNKLYNLLYDTTNQTLTMQEITYLSDIKTGLKTLTELGSTDYTWNYISISQKGKYQVAITFDTIYYSSDTGTTWNAKKMYCNGTQITNLNFVKVSYVESNANVIYTTITAGHQCYILDPLKNTVWLSDPTRTWIQSPQTFNYIQSISISSDSSIEVICDNTYDGKNGQIYTSKDYGYSWITTTPVPSAIQAPPIPWQDVAISKDNNGLYQTAVGTDITNGGIWTLYYNNIILNNTVVFYPIQSFVGFEQKIIDTSIIYNSSDINVPNPIYQYYFYNVNNLFSENYYNYSYTTFTVTNTNNNIQFVPENGHGTIDKYASQPITITIPPGVYSLYKGASDILTAINAQFSNTPELIGSYIQKISSNSNGYEYIEFVLNVNRIYTTKDYKLVFYDVYSFVSCFFGAPGVQNITWDNTLGWILGFRDFTEYYLTAENVEQPTSTSNNGFSYYKGSPTSVYTYQNTIDPITGLETRSIATLTGDTSVNTTLYNYFYIILDDYNQNHLNDGVVINIQSEANLPLPSYSSMAVQSCNNDGTATYTSPDLTQNQLYSVNTINQSAIPDITSQASIKQHASYPTVQDVFAFIPVKVNGQINGTTYVEFGGTLQNQNRLYFGPVNIHRMTVKLVTDKGDTLNLNNANWSFSFECEQLYRKT